MQTTVCKGFKPKYTLWHSPPPPVLEQTQGHVRCDSPHLVGDARPVQKLTDAQLLRSAGPSPRPPLGKLHQRTTVCPLSAHQHSTAKLLGSHPWPAP